MWKYIYEFRRATKETNKITRQKILDKNSVPITNLYYKKSKETLNSAKVILDELGKLFVEKDIGRIAIKSEIDNLEGYENLGLIIIWVVLE